jgi:hypothetical protein
MVSIGTEANVAVGAEGEERDLLEAETISGGGFKISGLDGKLGIGTEGEDRFKQGRSRDECLLVILKNSRMRASAPRDWDGLRVVA